MKILSIVFYVVALILVLFYWVSGTSTVGLIGNCIGLLGLVLSLCVLVKKARKKKSEADGNSQS